MIQEDIQTKKLNLIAWILQLQDVSLIEKLAELQSSKNEIPQWHKDIVLERIKTAKPEDYISWEQVKKQLQE